VSAVPGFQGLIDKQRLDGVAAQLVTDIQFARAEAVLRNTGVRLSLQTQAWGSCYVIHSGNANQCSCPEAGAALCADGAQQIKTVQLPAAERIAVQGNVSSILFDPLHGTSTPTGTLKLVAANGQAVHHVVNVMGRVRTCSPQGPAPAVSGYAVC
jgi:type IV fimbrial biogenesis protein FimT